MKLLEKKTATSNETADGKEETTDCFGTAF